MSRSSTNEDWWDRHLPTIVSKYVPSDITVPGDVSTVAGYLVVANVLLYALPTDALVVRSLLGFPLLFFVPGYVLVAILFPARKSAARHTPSPSTDGGRRLADSRGIGWRERLALSFGSSVALLPLLGLLISLVGLSYGTLTIVGTVSLATAVGLVPATLFRVREPATTRFHVPVESWLSTVKRGVGQDNRTAAVNVAVAALVLLSVAGVGYAMVAPNNAESFTSVSLLTTNDEGELVAADYPEAINESGAELTLELESAEESTTDYTVVAELQRVETSGPSVTVIERATVTQMETELAPGESWTRQHTVEPELSGEDLRLIYYVYEGDTPSEPSTESADDYVAIWVDVPPLETG